MIISGIISLILILFSKYQGDFAFYSLFYLTSLIFIALSLVLSFITDEIRLRILTTNKNKHPYLFLAIQYFHMIVIIFLLKYLINI